MRPSQRSARVGAPVAAERWETWQSVGADFVTYGWKTGEEGVPVIWERSQINHSTPQDECAARDKQSHT